MQKPRRLRSQRKAGRSHYQFKNWTWDECGKRQAAKTVRPLRDEYPDLINTCYFNRATGSETLYCIGLDLDAHRAGKHWKTKAGKLKWARIRRFLAEKHPEVFQYIFASVRSTSGNGLAVYFAISPLELVPSTKSAQKAARGLQGQLQQLFNRYELGADPAADGLKRDFCNWQNLEKTVYNNPLVLKAIQSDKTPVVTHLLGYLKPLKLSTYVRKSERSGLLYPDIRGERGLARLYRHLYDAWMDWEQDVYLSVAQIRELTGLSRTFVEKTLELPPTWLLTENCGRSEGWKLTVQLDPALTQRAFEVIEAGTSSVDVSKRLGKPEDVQDGSRNHWITHACLLLKHNGTPETQAVDLIAHHCEQIPGSSRSKNCKNARKICASIYENQTELFGIKPGCAPAWLLMAEQQIQHPPLRTVPNEPARRRESISPFKMPTTLQKGGYPPKDLVRKVSRDQCFIFAGHYYSLPREYINKEVAVFEWEGKLRVYDQDKRRHICTHTLAKHAKSKYQIHPDHVCPLSPIEVSYFDSLVSRLTSDGTYIGMLARKLIHRYQRLALRRLWLLQGLIRKYGAPVVDQAAQNSTSLPSLIKRVTYLSKGDHDASNLAGRNASQEIPQEASQPIITGAWAV